MIHRYGTDYKRHHVSHFPSVLLNRSETEDNTDSSYSLALSHRSPYRVAYHIQVYEVFLVEHTEMIEREIHLPYILRE